MLRFNQTDSVVKDIYVKKGQSVKLGEPLVAFDSTFKSDVEVKLSVESFNSKIDRLKKQSMLRTNTSIGNPSDERQNKKLKYKKN